MNRTWEGNLDQKHFTPWEIVATCEELAASALTLGMNNAAQLLLTVSRTAAEEAWQAQPASALELPTEALPRKTAL